MYKLSAGVDEWKEDSQTNAKVMVAKKFIQETIKAKTGQTRPSRGWRNYDNSKHGQTTIILFSETKGFG